MHSAARLSAMDVHAMMERESLASFLAGLPKDSHALVVVDELPIAEAIACCEAAARERGIRFGGVAPTLPQLVAHAHGTLSDGAMMVTVDAPASMGVVGEKAHLLAERATSTAPLGALSIICVYTRERVASLGALELITLGRSHRDILLPEAPR